MLDIRVVALLCVLAMTYALGTGEYLLEIALGSIAAMAAAAFCNSGGGGGRRSPPAEPWYMK